MRFRLHSMIAVFNAILLLPALGLAQQQKAAPAQQTPTGAQQMPNSPQQSPAKHQETPLQEKTVEAPIEPVMSGPYPVMSKAAEERGRQIFEMFNNTRSNEMWASLSEGLRKMSGKEEKFI